MSSLAAITGAAHAPLAAAVLPIFIELGHYPLVGLDRDETRYPVVVDRPLSMLTRTTNKAGHCLLAQWKNVAIAVWRSNADAETTRRMADFTDQMLREYPTFSVVHVIEENAGVPTREGRDGLVSTARAHQGQLICVGALLPQAALLATLMRAFVRAVRTLLRGNLNIIIEQDLGELIAQMVPLHIQGTGVRITGSELANVIAEARRLAAM